MDKKNKSLNLDAVNKFENMFDDNIIDEDEVVTTIGDDTATVINGEKVSSVAFSDEEVFSTDEDKAKKKAANSKNSFIYDIVSTAMSAIIIIAVLFLMSVRPVTVDGESMTNTLQHRDWLLTVGKSEYKQGDIVVIVQDTYFHEPLIKRVIATGGQTIDINYETGNVIVDGKVLEEPYKREDFIYEKYDDRDFPYTVPEGYLFCMGDNRNGSTDSRSDLVGPIDERQILGKAMVRVLPFGDFDIYDYE